MEQRARLKAVKSQEFSEFRDEVLKRLNSHIAIGHTAFIAAVVWTIVVMRGICAPDGSLHFGRRRADHGSLRLGQLARTVSVWAALPEL